MWVQMFQITTYRRTDEEDGAFGMWPLRASTQSARNKWTRGPYPLAVVIIKRRMPQSRSRSISNDYALLNGSNYGRVEPPWRGTRTSLQGWAIRNEKTTVSPREATEFFVSEEDQRIVFSAVSLVLVRLARLGGRLSSDVECDLISTILSLTLLECTAVVYSLSGVGF